MPEITSCPDCDKKLRVPADLLGRKVRCPGCSLMFVARIGGGERDEPRPARTGANRAEAFSERRTEREDLDRPLRRRDEEDEDDRRPRSRRDDFYDRERERDRPRGRYEDEDDEDYPRSRSHPGAVAAGWRGVRLGLNLAIIAAWLTIALIGIVIVGAGVFLLAGVSLAGLLSSAPPSQIPGQAASGVIGMGMGLMLFMGLLAFLVFIQTALRLTGYGLCMQAPNERNSSCRGLAIAAFSCAAGALLLNLVGVGMSGFGGGAALMMAGGGNIFGNIASLLAFAGYVCWLIFLRSVALQMRSPEVASRIIGFIITSLVFGAIAFVMFLIIVIVGVVSVFGAAGANSAAGAFQTMGAFMIFAIVMGGLLGLGSLALYIWYILLMTQVRNLVDRHLARM